jgi:hypothetical protein
MHSNLHGMPLPLIPRTTFCLIFNGNHLAAQVLSTVLSIPDRHLVCTTPSAAHKAPTAMPCIPIAFFAMLAMTISLKNGCNNYHRQGHEPTWPNPSLWMQPQQGQAIQVTRHMRDEKQEG